MASASSSFHCQGKRLERKYTSHYSNTSLFDDKAKTLLQGPTLVFHQLENEGEKQEITSNPDQNCLPKQLVISETLFCNSCQVDFSDREEQILHYKCDWHRYNLHLRLKGLQWVSEEEFELLSGDVSSISGSDNDSEDESIEWDQEIATPGVSVTEDERPKKDSREQRLNKIYFKNEQGELLSLFKCLLSHKKSPLSSSSEFESVMSHLLNQQKWAVLMVSSGHFAGAVFHGKNVVEHKTFHRYTIRAKRGTAQSAKDGQGNAPKSAGATLRRYNESALIQEVQDLLSGWKDHLDSCSLIFVRIPMANRVMFYGGKNPVLRKDDLRIRVIPFPTRRPTLNEVKRIQQMLSSIESYGQEAEVTDFIPLSPRRVYCKETDQLEITNLPRPSKNVRNLNFQTRNTNVDEKQETDESEEDNFDIYPEGPGNPLQEFETDFGTKKKRRKPKTKSEKLNSSPTAKDEVDEKQESDEYEEDDFDIYPDGPGNPLQEFETDFGTKKKRRKPKTKSEKLNPSPTLSKNEDDLEISIKNSMFTACKAGKDEDLHKVIADLQNYFTKNYLDEDEKSGESNDTQNGHVESEVCQATSETESHANTLGKVAEFLSHPLGHKGNTLLHSASEGNHHHVVTILLQEGADPAIKNKDGKTPYNLGSTEVKNAFRRFMALFPQRYDYVQAQIPSPLTEEMIAMKKQKNAAKKALKKKSTKEKNKAKKAEELKFKEENEIKERFLNLSDREKRALAAERRILHQQNENGTPKPVLSRCFQCGQDISGKVPFEYSDFKFCSTNCLRNHRAKAKS